jgi:hypothetical protein
MQLGLALIPEIEMLARRTLCTPEDPFTLAAARPAETIDC